MVSNAERKKLIAVVGTINRDTIFRSDGSRVDGYGGILFNVRTISHLLADKATIYPVANIGRDHADNILSELADFSNVRTDAIEVVSKPNNHCMLRYRDSSEKTEFLRGWVGAIRKQQLRLLLKCDLILINFISGGDITRRSLSWLRRNFTGPIYMDLHSRTLGRRHSDGARFLREPPFWREYVASADYLQLNYTEFRLLQESEPDERSCARFFSEYLGQARALLVTVGDQGCLLTWRKGASLLFTKVAPQQELRAIDTTGCGDVFSGGFISALFQGYSVPQATEIAVEVSSYASTKSHISELAFRPLQPR